jgi:hypothetical protein
MRWRSARRLTPVLCCRGLRLDAPPELGWRVVVSYIDTMGLNSRQRKTLEAIFSDPVRSNVIWTDVERLLLALGAVLTEGRGSRVRIHLNGVRAVFHRPHPQKETDKGALKSMRRLLIEAGIRPEESDA